MCPGIGSTFTAIGYQQDTSIYFRYRRYIKQAQLKSCNTNVCCADNTYRALESRKMKTCPVQRRFLCILCREGCYIIKRKDLLFGAVALGCNGLGLRS